MVSSPSFLDVFAVHLASRLLGTDEVLNRIENAFDEVDIDKRGGEQRSRGPGSSRLYWRTPLLVQLDSMSMLPPCWNENLPDAPSVVQCKPMFLDITFEFSTTNVNPKDKIGSDTSHPSVTTRLGAMLLLPSSRNGLYIKGEPLKMEELRIHAEKISIDIDSTNAQALAHSMANSFLDIVTIRESFTSYKPQTGMNEENHASSDSTSNSSKLSVSLFYEDLCEVGNLETSVTEVAEFQPYTMAMLFSNLRPEKCSEGSVADIMKKETHHPDVLTEAFDRWWRQSSMQMQTDGVTDSNSQSGSHSQSSSQLKRKLDPNEPKDQETSHTWSEETTEQQSKTGTTPRIMNIEVNTSATSETSAAKKTARTGIVVAHASTGKRRKRGKVTYAKAK